MFRLLIFTLHFSRVGTRLICCHSIEPLSANRISIRLLPNPCYGFDKKMENNFQVMRNLCISSWCNETSLGAMQRRPSTARIRAKYNHGNHTYCTFDDGMTNGTKWIYVWRMFVCKSRQCWRITITWFNCAQHTRTAHRTHTLPMLSKQRTITFAFNSHSVVKQGSYVELRRIHMLTRERCIDYARRNIHSIRH